MPSGKTRRERRRAKRAEQAQQAGQQAGQQTAETTPQQSQQSGALGDGLLQPGKQNLARVRRAINEGWPINPEIRKVIVNQMTLVVGRSEKPRDRIAAARVLVAADGANIQRERMDQADEHEELKRLAPPPPAANINITNTNQTGIQIIESDDWYGTRAAVESAPLPVLTQHPAALSAAHTNGTNGHTTNGHHTNGNGHSSTTNGHHPE